ncbi:MAG: ABC transporter substrate-binding protein [Clostridiales bacterium]|jgi:putative aldouronate transport system substrate-binding protein|nr:ABC transporter substrate-binding protein [Clostridiales bacterium]
MKKIHIPLSALIAIALSLSLAACSNGSSPGPSASAPSDASGGVASVLPLRFYMPGTGNNLDPSVIAKVNEKLASDQVGLDFQPLYIPWDAWVDRINIMISSNEEFELFHIMGDYVPYSAYYSRGAIQPLNEVIEQHAPDLLSFFNEDAWRCVSMDGKIYSIPDEWRDNSGDLYGNLHIRQDKLDAAGLTISDNFTIEELLDALEQLQDSWGGNVTPYIWDHSPTRPPIALHRYYDSWPYYTSLDGLFYVNLEGEAKAYFETEEFAKDCAIYAEMYNRGLIHPDILSVPQDTKNTLTTDGDILAGFDTFGEEGETALKNKFPEADIAPYRTAPEKPAVQDSPVLNMNAVPISAKHPESGVKFLNWLYSDEANHDLVIYGIEGTHYSAVEGDYIKTVYNEDTNLPLHRFDEWMVANLRYLKFEEGTPESIVSDWKGVTNPVVKLPSTGFAFDSEPVKVEYAQVRAEYDAVILPIKLGVVDYEENMPAALSTMKAAGIDLVVKEYQRQLDDYVASAK